MTKPLVTIITPTTNKECVWDNAESVRKQTYPNIQHLIVNDGVPGHYTDFKAKNDKVDCINLPYPTGTDRFNGHRIYGASLFLAKGHFVCFLDEDNTMEPDHIESLVDVCSKGNVWAYSLRKIVDTNGKFVCNDDCESLGKYKSILGDNFIDLNCFLLPLNVALQLAPVFYRKARDPGVEEIDRALSRILINENSNVPFDCNGKYSIRYRAGNTGISVQQQFFIQGNERMKTLYNGEVPWNKKT
jgi:glycosyltransferase involved in cell wall biosynthesis